jgi:phosphodiesterase/alkaline phosphatase D-like protein
MKYVWRTRAPFILAVSLSLSQLSPAQRSRYSAGDIPPPAKRATRVQVTEGPSLEVYRNNEAIIRWTSDNPGGTDEHFGVVSYGTDPKVLDRTASSHIRLNRNHTYTVFRVRVGGLKPATTYYYTVDSSEANGKRDGVKSPISHFTTPSDDNSGKKENASLK